MKCRMSGSFRMRENFRLHLLRNVDLEHGQHVADDVLDADAEGQAGLLDGGVCALDAAAAVEAVEGAGEVDDEAVDPAGVVFLSGHDDLLREGGQHPDEVHLGRLGQQGGIHLVGTRESDTLALHLLEDGADAGVCILDVVDRVVVVGLDGLVKVEVDAASGVVHVEQEAGAVDGHLFQQVGQGDGVAGALGHADGLTVAHQVDHLHQHDVEVVAVQADGIHGTLHAGDVAVVDKLLELGACYKAEDGAIMYRSAQYAAKYGTVNKKKTEDGTEEEAKDEVLVRANGIPTYFAADIAYHYNKLATRGFAKAIDVWGADHHGHVARMKGAMDAIGLNGNNLDVVLMQMVNLMRDGQPVRMSKRTGNAITLTDLLEEVPIDSARFLFNMHDAGSGIDFDLDQAVKTDNDNPVYYVQYAHARICSILKKMESEGVEFAGAEKVDATLLTEPSEMDLIRMLAAFPQEIVMAAEKYDPSRINRFVIDLASAFHRFYGNCRIQGADPAVQQARLALCIGVKNVIFNVLTMFKINVPEKM